MNELAGIVIVLGPYVLGSLLAGLALAGFTRWFFNRPQHWLFFAILLFSIPALFTGGDGVEGSLFKQLSWGGLFAFSAMTILGMNEGRIAWPREAVPRSLLLLVVFVSLSVIWAPNHLVSFKRTMQVVGVLVVALLIARSAIAGKGLREQLLTPGAVFLLLGLMLALAAPGVAFDQDHALRAFSSHKNTWGQFSLLASLAILFTLLASSRRRWLLAGLFILAVASLVLSRSTTSIIAFVGISASVVLLLLLYSSGIVGKLAVATLSVFAMAGILIFTILAGELPFSWLLDSVFRITEKSHTLTGRTFLWQLMGAEIERHPWLGIGYGSFWMGMDGPSAAVITRLNWGPPSQAHSGYIDVVNEIGILGASLLGMVLIGHGHRIYRLLRSGAVVDAGFHAALLVAVLLINYAESSLLRTTHLWWMVLCASIIEVHLKVRELATLQRQQVAPPQTFAHHPGLTRVQR